MNALTPIYDEFARLFSYPGTTRDAGREYDYLLRVHADSVSRIAPLLDKFRNGVEHLTTEELEELYTRTFDITPLANLEIGWHLYGEQYERGAFLVKMRDLLRRFRVEESSELPDHLTHVLFALGRMESTDADEFAAKYCIPALEKIQAGFKDQDNPYGYLTESLKTFIEHQHMAGVPSNE